MFLNTQQKGAFVTFFHGHQGVEGKKLTGRKVSPEVNMKQCHCVFMLVGTDGARRSLFHLPSKTGL